jgi:diamine N-acetyltransferase
VRVVDEVDALHRAHLPHIFRKPTGAVQEQAYYQGLITDENVGLFLAEVNGSVVGFVHAVIRDAPALPIFIPRRYAVVDNLGVKSDFRGGSIGRRLADAENP